MTPHLSAAAILTAYLDAITLNSQQLGRLQDLSLAQLHIYRLLEHDGTRKEKCAVIDARFQHAGERMEKNKALDIFCRKYQINAHENECIDARYEGVLVDLISAVMDGQPDELQVIANLKEGMGEGQIPALLYAWLYVRPDKEFFNIYEQLIMKSSGFAKQAEEDQITKYGFSNAKALQRCFRRAAAHRMGWDSELADLATDEQVFMAWVDVQSCRFAGKQAVNQAWQGMIEEKTTQTDKRLEDKRVTLPSTKALIDVKSVKFMVHQRLLDRLRYFF